MSQASTIEERLALVEKDVTELKSGFRRVRFQSITLSRSTLSRTAAGLKDD